MSNSEEQEATTSNVFTFIPYLIGKIRVEDILRDLNSSEENKKLYSILDKRVSRVHRSQSLYGNLFVQLNEIIENLNDKYIKYDDTLSAQNDNKSANTTEPTSSVSMGTQMRKTFYNGNVAYNNQREILVRLKPGVNPGSTEYVQYDIGSLIQRVQKKKKKQALKQQQQQQQQQEQQREQQKVQQNEYPKRIRDNSNDDIDYVIIGPNGTKIEGVLFDEITWSSAASATRSLLGYIFDTEILSTHTLTGKPSPAFYGRERPPKMQLDPKITSDIIYCVRSKCNGNEREIRSAITTKCADTAKKVKRRLLRKPTAKKSLVYTKIVDDLIQE